MARKNNTDKAKSSGGHGRLQTFSLAAPAAENVQLVGDFTKWETKPVCMEKAPDGTWHTCVELAPGAHPYRFIVDGQWSDDPQCTLREPNPYGTQNAIRQVP